MEQRYRIFFFSPEKFTGHSFIQIPKCCFFFPAKREKKNTSWFFSITGKVHRSFIWILRKFVFFYKIGCVFFFPAFLCGFCVFFVPRKSSHVNHSFNFGGRKKKTQSGKKKTAFSFIHSIFLKKAQKRIHSIFLKKAQKRTYPENKKKYGTFVWRLKKTVYF